MKYNFIVNLTKQDVAGILTCCGYALREDISLSKALEEMGFEIDIAGVKDFCTQHELCHLGSFCITQLTYEQLNEKENFSQSRLC